MYKSQKQKMKQKIEKANYKILEQQIQISEVHNLIDKWRNLCNRQDKLLRQAYDFIAAIDNSALIANKNLLLQKIINEIQKPGVF